AEDAILDRIVTGVQTCALPICRARRGARVRPEPHPGGGPHLLRRGVGAGHAPRRRPAHRGRCPRPRGGRLRRDGGLRMSAEERTLERIEANVLTVMLTRLGSIADALAEKHIGSERVENLAILAVAQGRKPAPNYF